MFSRLTIHWNLDNNWCNNVNTSVALNTDTCSCNSRNRTELMFVPCAQQVHTCKHKKSFVFFWNILMVICLINIESNNFSKSNWWYEFRTVLKWMYSKFFTYKYLWLKERSLNITKNSLHPYNLVEYLRWIKIKKSNI